MIHGQWVTPEPESDRAPYFGQEDIEMDETSQNGEDGEEFDEQFEQMLIENGVLVHAIATLLVRKGILKQEEIDSEMDRLYEEMENFDH